MLSHVDLGIELWFLCIFERGILLNIALEVPLPPDGKTYIIGSGSQPIQKQVIGKKSVKPDYVLVDYIDAKSR